MLLFLYASTNNLCVFNSQEIRYNFKQISDSCFDHIFYQKYNSLDDL